MILSPKKISWLFIITAFLFCASTSAFGLSYNTLYVEDLTSKLYILDDTSGVATEVGDIGIPYVSDIAFSGTTLYGITLGIANTDGTKDYGTLIKIDPDKATGTLVGDLGVMDMNALVVASDGTLYAAGWNSGDFYSINSNNGDVTLIGNYGVKGGSSGDLEFVNGTLYASVFKDDDFDKDYLATIDLATGKASDLWGFSDKSGRDYRDVFGLGYKDQTLYGATSAGELLKIDTNNKLVSQIGSFNGTSQWGMSVSPVPEPATILLLCTGLGAVGLTRFRKRFKK